MKKLLSIFALFASTHAAFAQAPENYVDQAKGGMLEAIKRIAAGLSAGISGGDNIVDELRAAQRYMNAVRQMLNAVDEEVQAFDDPIVVNLWQTLNAQEVSFFPRALDSREETLNRAIAAAVQLLEVFGNFYRAMGVVESALNVDDLFEAFVQGPVLYDMNRLNGGLAFTDFYTQYIQLVEPIVSALLADLDEDSLTYHSDAADILIQNGLEAYVDANAFIRNPSFAFQEANRVRQNAHVRLRRTCYFNLHAFVNEVQTMLGQYPLPAIPSGAAQVKLRIQAFLDAHPSLNTREDQVRVAALEGLELIARDLVFPTELPERLQRAHNLFEIAERLMPGHIDYFNVQDFNNPQNDRNFLTLEIERARREYQDRQKRGENLQEPEPQATYRRTDFRQMLLTYRYEDQQNSHTNRILSYLLMARDYSGEAIRQRDNESYAEFVNRAQVQVVRLLRVFAQFLRAEGLMIDSLLESLERYFC